VSETVFALSFALVPTVKRRSVRLGRDGIDKHRWQTKLTILGQKDGEPHLAQTLGMGQDDHGAVQHGPQHAREHLCANALQVITVTP
jgi:hypothetical protein